MSLLVLLTDAEAHWLTKAHLVTSVPIFPRVLIYNGPEKTLYNASSPSRSMPSQGKHWILTIPREKWDDPGELPTGCVYIRGQAELGDSGYQHWQVYVVLERKGRLGAIKRIFPPETHAELTRSDAARDYCWKEDTRIPCTQFEYGRLPHRRNESKDWDSIWESATEGDLESIPADVRVVHYRTLRTISYDYLEPVAMERTVYVFCGKPGTGKSRRAWDEAGLDAYPKDPLSKFWDSYRGQKHVVIDEFRGGIDIAHILRWLDRYPVIVGTKGSATVLCAEKIWITTNVHPELWYPQVCPDTTAALLRRLNITIFE